MEVDFHKSLLDDYGFLWMNKPSSWKQFDEGFQIFMDAKCDFWRKTYYKPSFIANTGHLLYKEFATDENVMVETCFHLSPINQFDQAGLMVYVDEEHWIKTGIEFVDSTQRLSCVVTNDYSDWSTQEAPSTTNIELRVYKMGSSFVVEAKNGEGEWNFIRICHLRLKENTRNVKIGLYACAPKAKDGNVVFSRLSYKNVDSYDHTN